MRTLAERVFRSIGFYPITMLYIVSFIAIVLIVRGVLSPVIGLIGLGLVTILTLLIATWRELVTVRQMVDGQRTEMIERMDALIILLVEHNIAIPGEGPREHEARLQEVGGPESPKIPNTMSRPHNHYGQGETP